MKHNINIKDLAKWITSLKVAAKNDTQFLVDWFEGTKDSKFSIIGGWDGSYSENQADILCSSAGDPSYAMCVKIITNEGPYAYADFEVLNMPIDKFGDVDNTCIALEWDDDPEQVAQFFLGEWERIMKEHEEEI